ncbi:head-tail connector protein [Phaeobacter marinintestinus]|uniref:head-tail connector protein n=1 Tax=Falsiphaeobacter marinintestinus TaxID=1492905 RepID=UPI0011B3EE8D|nr:head-tail connector protein [Phaeobacter marinintestinus]
MMLTEVTTVADAALPVDEFKAHLRLGTGFGEETLQDAVLTSFLRAAIAAIEGRTGKVLLSRDFTWEIADWSDRSGQGLPVAPVNAVSAVVLIGADESETVVAYTLYRLRRDAVEPRLFPTGTLLPRVETKGSVRINFNAGMSSDWGGLPADLGQAVLLLAAHYYEYRDETALGEGCMPFGVSSLLQRYRKLRVTLGGVQ